MNTNSLKPFEDKNYLSTEEALKLLEKYAKQNTQEPSAPEPVQEPAPVILPAAPAPSPANIADPKDYLILEHRTHGSYSYSDLLVAKSLSHHGKNWYQCHQALHQESFEMLTLRQFVDFLNLLKSGKVFDGKGNQVSSSELETILKEITEQRDPWRAEWLDADFKVVKDKLHITYEHHYVHGNLQPQKSEPLQGCLMKDKTPGIDLNDYPQRATSQGMPPADVKSGSLYYWSPTNGGVARFWAIADRVSLYCRDNPLGSSAALGVRRRRAKN